MKVLKVTRSHTPSMLFLLADILLIWKISVKRNGVVNGCHPYNVSKTPLHAIRSLRSPRAQTLTADVGDFNV